MFFSQFIHYVHPFVIRFAFRPLRSRTLHYFLTTSLHSFHSPQNPTAREAHSIRFTCLPRPAKNLDSKNWTIMASNTLIVLKSWQLSKAASTLCQLLATTGVQLSIIVNILKQEQYFHPAPIAIITATTTGLTIILFHLHLLRSLNTSWKVSLLKQRLMVTKRRSRFDHSDV